ncbi:hypothetical protein JOM56_005037 [Amanita muscaria]
MKLTTAAVLAFVATSVLGSPISSKATAVSARDLYERNGGEGFLESFEKRGGGLGPSLFKSIADMFGIMGGRVATSSAQNGIAKHFFPPSKPAATSKPQHHPPQHPPQHPPPQHPLPQHPPPERRSLEARVKRRALSRPVARAFAPGQAIKSVVTRVSKSATNYYRRSAPMRKTGRGATISFFDGVAKGIAVRGLEEDVLDELD